MFEEITSWFQSLGGHRFWLVVVLAAIGLLIWVAAEMRDRRDERRAADAADADWAAEVAARKRLPTALSIPDVVHVKQEPVAPVADAVIQSIRRRAVRSRPASPPKRAKRPNRRKVARHK